MDGWIKVIEQLPSNTKGYPHQVDFYSITHGLLCGLFFNGQFYSPHLNERNIIYCVTHWRERPEKPEEYK